MNSTFNLETIFRCAAIQKATHSPPHSEEFVASFSEDQYFKALEFIKRIPKASIGLRRLYLVGHGGDRRLIVTKVPKQERP